MMEISDGRRRWTVLLDDDDVGWADDDEEAIRGAREGWEAEPFTFCPNRRLLSLSQSRRGRRSEARSSSPELTPLLPRRRTYIAQPHILYIVGGANSSWELEL